MMTSCVTMKRGLALWLLAFVCASQADALERNDTMSGWLHSSDADRSNLLDKLQATGSKPRQANRARVMDCMNAAAEVAGHGELRIGDVAEACSLPPSSPNGDAQTDI